jgi:hypothetical protein
MSWQGMSIRKSLFATPPCRFVANIPLAGRIHRHEVCASTIWHFMVPEASATLSSFHRSLSTDNLRYSLVGSGHIDKGAIVSLAGDSVWAASATFSV